MNSTSIVPIGIAFLVCAPISPIMHLIGFNASIASIALSLMLVILLLRNKNYKIERSVLYLGVFLLLTSVIPALYWGNIKYITLPYYYIFGVFIASFLDYEEHLMCVDIFTKLCILFLVGAFLGQFYVSIGGGYLYEFTMADGRNTYFFPVTLSNVVLDSIIRASSIFDEPGAFSFFICFLVVYREILKQNRIVTDLIIILGMVTFSFAHVIFAIFYVANKKSIKQALAVIFIILITGVGSGFGEGSFFYEVFLNRLEIVDGVVVGDNRSEPLILAFDNIDFDSFFFGKDSSCVFDREICHVRYGYMGENFLSPLVFYGIFGSMFYYFSVVIFLIIGTMVRGNVILFLGVVALLLQRPYSMSPGYSLMLALLFFSTRVVGSIGSSSIMGIWGRKIIRLK